MGRTKSRPVLIQAVVLTMGAVAMTSAQHVTEWSSPVNLGEIVNSPFNDQQPALSPDGLSLYFASNRPGGAGALDLWVARRASLAAPWQAPVPLPASINTPAGESTPAFADAGHVLLFARTGPDGCGGATSPFADLWVSFRTDKRDDFDWQEPAHLGCVVNSVFPEEGPSYVEEDDDGADATLYFHSFLRPGGLGAGDIWASTIGPDGTISPPVNVVELNTGAQDLKPTVRRGGEEIIFNSNRSGNFDLWAATRDSHSLVWSPPQNLGSIVNSSASDNAPSLSRDGLSLLFDSDRPGGVGFRDLYVSTRARAHPRK